ncbi:MAG TPA: glycine betaine ABC transporter substrate-binding protein [Nitrospira sp.]|nr:glycine betaine ABC transporter substrate-binding protein [Nitrospira sp.]
MGRTTYLAAVMLAAVLAGCPKDERSITVGSKNFLEQVLLGEIAAQHLEHRLGDRIARKLNLGGTLLVHQAIINGDVDLYPEYTGTGAAILNMAPSQDGQQLLAEVRREYAARFRLVWLEPLGFSNTFAMVIRKIDADRAQVRTISDTERRPVTWVLGMGYEFQQRADGLPSLLRTYKLPIRGTPKVMDLGLLYRALEQGEVTMIAANSTDGPLASPSLVVLEDDRHCFPAYHAAFVVRQHTLSREPRLQAALEELSGQFSEDVMRRLNAQVLNRHGRVEEVAKQFLTDVGLRPRSN